MTYCMTDCVDVKCPEWENPERGGWWWVGWGGGAGWEQQLSCRGFPRGAVGVVWTYTEVVAAQHRECTKYR